MARFRPNKYALSLGVKIGHNVNFYGMRPGMFGSEPWLISIGNNVHITGEVQFINHDGGTLILRDIEPKLEITKPIVVGDNVFIGFRSIILPGSVIGNNVVVAAGSIVSGTLESGWVYGGVPVKKIKSVDKYLEKLKKESLNFGHLGPREKEDALKKYFRSI